MRTCERLRGVRWDSAWRFRGAIAFLVLALGAPAAMPAHAKWAYTCMARAEVPLTGEDAAIRLPWTARPWNVKIVLAGTFYCAYDGRTYDAVKATNESGEFELRHNYVRWSPDELERPIFSSLGGSERAYELHFPLEAEEVPESVSAWIDIDQFATDLSITPSEVRKSLSGNLRVEVWQQPSRPCSPFYYETIAIVILLGLAGVGACAFLIARRRK